MIQPPLTFAAWLRFGLIKRLLRGTSGVRSVLEVGMGQGAIGARLVRSFRYEGVEPDTRSFEVARQRIVPLGGRVHLGDIAAVPAGSAFDLLCAFEVLEHIKDDRLALQQWRQRLRPDGWLMLSVPAHQRRYGPMDRHVGHFRRYERVDLKRLLESTGFRQITIETYGFPLGYVLEWVRNALGRRFAVERGSHEGADASGRLLQPARWAGWLTWLVALAPRFVRADLGIGYVVRARRLAE